MAWRIFCVPCLFISSVCKSMKRCLVIGKFSITMMVVSYAAIRNMVWQCLKNGLWTLSFCCGSSFHTVYLHKTRFGQCQKCIMQNVWFAQLFCWMLTYYNSRNKRNGLVHLLDAVPVHFIFSEYMKCILAIVKVLFINMVRVLYILIRFWLVL